MAGFAHYKNGKAGTRLYEPVFNAYFDIMITPPPGISDWDLTMNNILGITGIDLAKMPEKVTQKYRNASRTFIGGAVPDQSQEIDLSFEVNLKDDNSMYVYNSLRKWSDLAYNPLTGKFGIKKDYVGGPMVITQYNANGDIFRQITFKVVFPGSQVKGPDTIDWSSAEVYKVEGWKLIADDWEETWL
jgi:hypothetical protein